jgi:hypothetical protein
MGKCKNHPGVDGVYYCSKYNYHLCDQCLKCSDPNVYCKFRTSCVIHFMEKERKVREKC